MSAGFLKSRISRRNLKGREKPKNKAFSGQKPQKYYERMIQTMNKSFIGKKLLSLLLSVLMCLSLIPSVAFATIAEGETATVAKIGEAEYKTLAEAIAAAKDGDTVTLLADCSGDGIRVATNKYPTGITIDFAGYSYTVGGKLVGSTGTASNGFQLLAGNTITMKNGFIYGDASVAGDDITKWSGAPAIMIQNYSNLTLDNMTVSGGKQTVYTISNNNGNTVIKDSIIKAGNADGISRYPFAFDVCRYSSYPSVSVTVPREVPLIKIVTPGSGLPERSVTLPVTSDVLL